MGERAVDLKKASTELAELVDQAARGEEIVITLNGEPVARIVPISPAKRARRFGSARERIVIHDDFDAPLEDFRDYR